MKKLRPFTKEDFTGVFRALVLSSESDEEKAHRAEHRSAVTSVVPAEKRKR